MNNMFIYVDPTIYYQRQIINFPIGDETKRVIFETRYLEATDKWYISLYNAQDGSPICLYIPVIATYEEHHNLFEPYIHKRIGWLVCYCLVDDPSSENPSKDNMGEFGFFWGDTYGPEYS